MWLILAWLFGADEDPLAAVERHQQALFTRTAPSVVFIAAGDGFGSGFFVNPRGLVLTNAHVVGDKARVEVVLHDGRRVKGLVVERGRNKIDLALVQLDLEGTPPLELVVQEDLKVGSWVASVGHGAGGIWSFNIGSVSNFYALPGEPPILQTQIPLHPGNSGGPIINRRGEVVAIINRGRTDTNNINFGILVADAYEHLEKLDVPCRCLMVRGPAQTPILVEGAMVGLGPRVVLPVSNRPRELSAVVGGALKVVVAKPGTAFVDLTGP